MNQLKQEIWFFSKNMPKIKHDFFQRAQEVAKKSTMIHRHGAVIIKNGKIIGEGCNYYAKYMCHSYSVHAEVAALQSLRKQHRHKKFLEDSVMIVVRVQGLDNHCCMSSPCSNCRQAISEANIKLVLYSQ